MSNPKWPVWRGAWPEEVWLQFLTLTSEEAIKRAEAGEPITLSGLLNLEKTRRERIAELRARVFADEGYARLLGLAGFDTVMQERQRLANRNPLFADPFGEIRLTHDIAMFVGGHDANFKPKRATLTHQRKTYRVARELARLLMPGAQPADVFEWNELRRLLDKLQNELGAQIAKAERLRQRPFRADKDAGQRYWVGGFCEVLRKTFGEAPPVIVREVASMMNYHPDDSTIARYTKGTSGRPKTKR